MISRGPQIVRDGLVLYLDPANKKSYPGSGISTTNLIDRTKKGVLLPESFFSSFYVRCDPYTNIAQSTNIDGYNIVGQECSMAKLLEYLGLQEC